MNKSVERRLAVQKEKPGAFERLRDAGNPPSVPGELESSGWQAGVGYAIAECIALAEELRDEQRKIAKSYERDNDPEASRWHRLRAAALDDYAARLKEAIGE